MRRLIFLSKVAWIPLWEYEAARHFPHVTRCNERVERGEFSPLLRPVRQTFNYKGRAATATLNEETG